MEANPTFPEDKFVDASKVPFICFHYYENYSPKNKNVNNRDKELGYLKNVHYDIIEMKNFLNDSTANNEESGNMTVMSRSNLSEK